MATDFTCCVGAWECCSSSARLFTDMSVYDNIAFQMREHTDLPESVIRDLVMMKLHAVGLRGAHDLMPSELSGGMARRVASGAGGRT
jgi:ABC-type transporter Mla maintaining outer membrane lipid asymmetry ATPase subunit MlaF